MFTEIKGKNLDVQGPLVNTATETYMEGAN